MWNENFLAIGDLGASLLFNLYNILLFLQLKIIVRNLLLTKMIIIIYFNIAHSIFSEIYILTQNTDIIVHMKIENNVVCVYKDMFFLSIR